MQRMEQNLGAMGDLVKDSVGLALAVPAAATAWTSRLPFVSHLLTITDKALCLPLHVAAGLLR